MSAKQNFCPVGEELESRSLLNIGTPVLGAFLGIESLHESEHRAMVQQRVHARTLPKTSEHSSESSVTVPTFSWEIPAGLALNFKPMVHPHVIQMRTHTFAGHDTTGPGQQPAHAGKQPPLSLTPAANLPAGVVGAFNRG